MRRYGGIKTNLTTQTEMMIMHHIDRYIIHADNFTNYTFWAKRVNLP